MVRAVELALESTKLHESFSARPYRDKKGRIAIGYGWSIVSEPMTREAADVLVQQMLSRMAGEVLEEFPFVVRLSPVRQSIVLEMRYQLGMDGLKGFEDFLRFAEAGDFERAADEMLNSKWAVEDTPARARTLASEFRSGQR